jgi:hypothetical protein
LAAKNGISLISIGSSSNPDDLAVIPELIAATQHLSCSFCLPATADWTLCQQAAAAVMQTAALTGEAASWKSAQCNSATWATEDCSV